MDRGNGLHVYWQEPRGWLLGSSATAPTHKCDKCPREFFSSLNCRRHSRLHRKNVDKDDLLKHKDELGQFWAQLSPAKASGILSVTASAVDVIVGSKIEPAVRTYLRISALTHNSYLKAGAQLEHLRSGSKPASAGELFTLLNDASEKTFLIGGTSDNVAKSVLPQEDERNVERNAIAALAFLIEDNLVKAWKADKDAKALLATQELFAEEEAAQQKRQRDADRKRLKKQRQRERKAVDNAVDSGAHGDADLQDAEPTASAAAVSEASDDQEHVAAAPAARWGDEPEPEPEPEPELQPQREPDYFQGEFTVTRPQRRRYHPNHPAVNQPEPVHQPRYQPRHPSRGANVGANGYSVWTRRTRASVCDAYTTVDGAAETNRDGAEAVGSIELPRSGSGTGAERSSRRIRDEEDRAPAPKVNVLEQKPPPVVATAKPEPIVATAKPEPIVASPKPEPIVASPKPEPIVASPKPEPIVVETVKKPDDQQEQPRREFETKKLMIGSVLVPLALDTPFDSLEKELLMPEKRRSDDTAPKEEPKQLEDESAAAAAAAAANTELEEEAMPVEEDFIDVMETCLAFLANRWRETLADSDSTLVFISSDPVDDEGEAVENEVGQSEAAPPEAGPTGKSGSPDADEDGPGLGSVGNPEEDVEAAVDSSGVAAVGGAEGDAAGGSGGVGGGDGGGSGGGGVLSRLDGTYDKKGGSKWKKSKASERRYLPKKQ